MKHSDFFKKLGSFGVINAALRDYLSSILIELQFEQGDLLVQITENKNPELYYIESGLVRGSDSYHGKRISIWIAGDDSLFIVQNLKGKSIFREQMHFLRDTQLYVLDLEKTLQASTLFPEIIPLFANMLYECILEGKNREHLLRLNPEEKVRFMEKCCPEVINSTNLEAIASYLNISRRHFIRTRGMLARRRDK